MSDVSSSAATAGEVNRLPQLLGTARAHYPFVAVLAVAALVRIAFWVQLHPALLFTDSWTYWHMALRAQILGVDAGRPSGYPAILKILVLPTRNMAVVTAIQHVAGLLTGTILYAMLIRWGVRRWLATAAMALALLDAYTITSEQFIEAEAFFALVMVTALWLTVVYPDSWRVTALAGALLGVAVTIRTAGLFFIPVWLGYVLWTRRPSSSRPVAAATAGVVVPIAIYLGIHAAVGAGFRFESADGRLLYGRVGSIVNGCRGATVPSRTRPLCDDKLPHPQSPNWYIFDPQSPASRLFPGGYNQSSNGPLRAFALAIIRAHPLAYGRLVASDLADFFIPGQESGGDLGVPQRGDSTVLEGLAKADRDKYFPTYRTPEPGSASIVAHYHDWARVPRVLFGLTVLVAAVDVVVPARNRQRPRRAEVVLLAGGTLLALLISVATVAFYMRYAVPFQPLLLAAAALAITDLWGSRSPAGSAAVPGFHAADG